MRVQCSWICLLLLVGAQAGAATWNVATGRTDASDDNPGTAEKPWKTISQAAACLEPGDTVIILADPRFLPAAADWKARPDSSALKLGAGPIAPPAVLASVVGVEDSAAHEPATNLVEVTGPTGTSSPSGRPRYYYPVPSAEPPQQVTADVCVYGATPGGVMAAIQARRMGKQAILVEFGRNVGGMTASGLSDTDGGEPAITGGLAAEFYRRVGQRSKFRPSQAERTFRTMLGEAKVPLYVEHRLKAVRKQGNRITEIVAENGNRFRARMFVDATYEGDLLAKAGVSYTVGREGNAKYGESINGVIYGPKDNFDRPVDPYRIPGRPDSGLLSGVDATPRAQVGEGDRRVQAYNFRMWLVPAAVGRPFPKPAGYDSGRYALLLRYIAAGSRHVDLHVGDNNNHHLFNGAFSTDDIGANYDWPEADYATRERIYQEHVTYQQGLMYFLANDSRVPSEIRAKVTRLALPKDEFVANGGWPHQLYVREARRMLSPYVMTEHNGTGKVVAKDSVALASYQMDSHNTCRLVVDGKACNEGQTYKAVVHALPLSYRAICPRQSECGNLLVVFCISASHIGLSTLRMEPVLMITGQSAGTAACLAIDAGCDAQDVPYLALRQRLLRDGQILDPPPPAKRTTGTPAGFIMATGNRLGNTPPACGGRAWLIDWHLGKSGSDLAERCHG